MTEQSPLTPPSSSRSEVNAMSEDDIRELRAERDALEAAIERVRALCSEPNPHPGHDHICPDEILAALDHPTDTG